MAATQTKLHTEQALAGLGYAFEPVSLAPKARRSPQKSHRAPPAAAAAAPPKVQVTFSLPLERGPGPAYGSPPSAAQQPSQSGAASWPGSAAHGAAGLAALKLASLRRRAAVLAGAPAAAELEGPAGAQPAQLDQAAGQPAGEQQRDEQGALLRCMEERLAGCGSGVLHEPAAAPPPPQHVLLGLPALAPGPPAAVLASSLIGSQSEPLIGAYRPSEGASAVAPCLDARPEASSHPSEERAAATPAAAGSHGSSAATAADPRNLEQALQCLGLLDPQSAEGRPGGKALPSAVSSSSSEGAAGQLRWVRLRAVQVAVATKQQAAAAADLLPLVQRLRQVRMHLVFHQVGRASS